MDFSILTWEDKGPHEGGTPISTFPLERMYFLLADNNILLTIYYYHKQMSPHNSSGNEGGSHYKAFYVPPEWEPIWREFKRICQREGETASHIIRRMIEQYVAAHRKGNLQLTLDRYATTKVLVAGRCFLCSVTDVAWVGFYRLRDGSLRRRLLCDSCKRAAEVSPSWQKFERIEGPINDTDLQKGG